MTTDWQQVAAEWDSTDGIKVRKIIGRRGPETRSWSDLRDHARMWLEERWDMVSIGSDRYNAKDGECFHSVYVLDGDKRGRALTDLLSTYDAALIAAVLATVAFKEEEQKKCK